MASNPVRVRRSLRDVAVLAALALAAAAARASAAASELVVDVYVDRPAVLAFVPVSTDGGGDPALARALAAQALSLASACLGRRPAFYQLVVADRIVLHDGARLTEFDIAGTAPLVGFLLAAPKANPRMLFAGGGPESLTVLAPFAAGQFFHQACWR